MQADGNVSTTDSPLQFIRKFSIDILNTTQVKMLVVMFGVTITASAVLQTCYNFSLDLGQFIGFAPHYFLQIQLLVSLAFIVTYKSIINEIFDKIPRQSFDVGGVALKKLIKKEAFKLDLAIVTMLTLGFTCSILHVFPGRNDQKMFFTLAWTQTHLPLWSHLMISLFYRCTVILFSAFLAQLSGIQMAYKTKDITFQFYVLYSQIEDINSGYQQMNDENLIGNEVYHAKIRRRLVWITKRYVEFFKADQSVLKRLEVFIILFSLSATALATGLFLFIFSVKNLTILDQVRVVLFVIISLITGTGFVIIGQNMEDKYHRLFDVLNNVEWYNWNIENQKLYLLLLTATLKPFQFKYSENVAFNYELGIKVLRAVYCVGSIFGESLMSLFMDKKQ